MDEAKILGLCRELERDVERSEVSVTLLVRRALKLAELTEDLEYKMLFEMHLTGHQRARSSPGFGGWPEGRVPKWHFGEAFLDDRRQLGSDQIIVYPLEQVEAMLGKVREITTTPGVKLPADQWENAIRHETELGAIVGNIRNRIAVFVTNTEKQHVSHALSPQVEPTKNFRRARAVKLVVQASRLVGEQGSGMG